MHVFVSGSSGFVGSALVPSLAEAGYQVGKMVRPGGVAGPLDLFWDPITGRIDAGRLEGADAVVHLAGENIASGRWTAARKERIRKSRIDGTLTLSRALAKAQRPPRVLLSASAIGFYGDRGDEILDESSQRGSGFLPAVCVGWESATEPAEQRGIRTVNLRFGAILSPRGGALKRMLPPFRLGLGGRLGSGRQYMSWVSLDDTVGAIRHALTAETLRGPVNVVSPGPVTNLEFTRALGRVLGRPTLFPMPAAAARLAFGELADAVLLASARVLPRALRSSGYRFAHAELEPALRDLLGS
ncbi:MAG: TIGR01777 family oxidoreductase [Acidobacteriota bacterium]